MLLRLCILFVLYSLVFSLQCRHGTSPHSNRLSKAKYCVWVNGKAGRNKRDCLQNGETQYWSDNWNMIPSQNTRGCFNDFSNVAFSQGPYFCNNPTFCWCQRNLCNTFQAVNQPINCHQYIPGMQLSPLCQGNFCYEMIQVRMKETPDITMDSIFGCAMGHDPCNGTEHLELKGRYELKLNGLTVIDGQGECCYENMCNKGMKRHAFAKSTITTTTTGKSVSTAKTYPILSTTESHVTNQSTIKFNPTMLKTTTEATTTENKVSTTKIIAETTQMTTKLSTEKEDVTTNLWTEKQSSRHTAIIPVSMFESNSNATTENANSPTNPIENATLTNRWSRSDDNQTENMDEQEYLEMTTTEIDTYDVNY